MTILTAREGYTYTNGTIYGKEIYLSNLDSETNWAEITDKEAQEKQMLAEISHETTPDYSDMLNAIYTKISEQADINAQQDDMITELYESILGGTE